MAKIIHLKLSKTENSKVLQIFFVDPGFNIIDFVPIVPMSIHAQSMDRQLFSSVKRNSLSMALMGYIQKIRWHHNLKNLILA